MLIGCRVFQCFYYFKPKNFKTVKTSIPFFDYHRRFSKGEYVIIKKKDPEGKLKTMKLDSPQFKSCLTEEVQVIQNLFVSNGFEIRIVGGAVRDLLLGNLPTDLDFATTATPEEMKKIFVENDIRMINTNGERHGTITARINEKNLEITTLRVDMATDGRFALVEFTKDWLLDANRRDLTINAMYLGFDGTVYDYFNGVEDLKNHRVIFVGDASDRIQEDYLRILRYFRFYGKVANVPDNHDESTIKAIRENAKGLEIISGERIWIELNKILSGKFAGEMLQKIISLNLGPFIGLPENCNVEELKKVCDRLKLKDISVKPVTLLVSIFRTEDEIMNFCKRIKPSCAERDLALFLLNNRHDLRVGNPIRNYKSLIIQEKKHFVFELIKYKGHTEFLEELEKWNVPAFPVNGFMLKEKGVPEIHVGVVKNKLKEIWIEHDFEISIDKLLEQIPTNLPPVTSYNKRQRKK